MTDPDTAVRDYERVCDELAEAERDALVAITHVKRLTDWIRDYATAHDFEQYPKQLVDAEEWLDRLRGEANAGS